MAGINTRFRDNLQNFLDMPGEKIILYTRQHYLCLFPPLLSLFLFVGPFFCISFFLLVMLSQLYFLTPLVLFLVAFLLNAITKIVIDWYFHLYVITTHKLMEVFYSPFFLYKTNTILLDQVRCTEIDEDKHGVFEGVFDFGNITLTFDRPTHSEEFILYHISNPTRTAAILSRFLITDDNGKNSRFSQVTKPTFFGRRTSYA